MEELVEKLAIALHDDSKCQYPFFDHTERSKEGWRQQARVAIEFVKQHREAIFEKSN